MKSAASDPEPGQGMVAGKGRIRRWIHPARWHFWMITVPLLFWTLVLVLFWWPGVQCEVELSPRWYFKRTRAASPSATVDRAELMAGGASIGKTTFSGLQAIEADAEILRLQCAKYNGGSSYVWEWSSGAVGFSLCPE